MKDLRDNVQRFSIFAPDLLAVFNSVIKNRDQIFEAHKKGLELATKSQNKEEALEHLKRAYELYPINLKVINDLGMIYLQLGLYDKSMEILQKGIAISSKDRLILLTMKEVKSALAHLEHIKGREAIKEYKNHTLALTYFEKAFSLDPDNSTYANNLGVAYLSNKSYQQSFEILKIGLERTASDVVLKRSFEALKSALMAVNMEKNMTSFEKEYKLGKRLCAHLLVDDLKSKSVNQPGLFSTDDYDDDEDDEDDDEEEEDDEEVSEDVSDARFAAAKVNPDGSVSVPHKTATKTTSTTTSSSKSSNKSSNNTTGVITTAVIREWLGDWIFSDDIKNAVKVAFRNKIPYEIKPFLVPEKAEALYSTIKRLSDGGHMRLMKGYSKSFQFHHHNMYESQDKLYNSDPTLKTLHDIMDTPYVRKWFADVSGYTINIKTTSTISYYKPGDYSMLHHDSSRGPDDGWRKVAFVLHMCKVWDPMYGGDLMYINPLKLIHAQYNNMVLFKVIEGESWHIVTPIAEHTPAHMQRFAYSGWWNGPHYEN